MILVNMKIAIYSNFERDLNGNFAIKFYGEFQKQGANVFLILKNKEDYKKLQNINIGTFNDFYDLIITIGGDGTTLESIQGIYKNGTNVISINAGHLGFLSEYSTKEEFSIENIVSKLLKKEYKTMAKFCVVISSSPPSEKVKKIIVRGVCTKRVSFM